MYERPNERPISRKRFLKRMLSHLVIAMAIVVVSLGMGISGFMFFEKMPFHQAFLNSSMLLGGLGLIEKPVTHVGHWFVGIYGLYSGLVFIVSFGILLAPTLHRIVHKLQWVGDAS